MLTTLLIMININLDFFGRDYHDLPILPRSDRVARTLMQQQCVTNSATNSFFDLR